MLDWLIATLWHILYFWICPLAFYGIIYLLVSHDKTKEHVPATAGFFSVLMPSVKGEAWKEFWNEPWDVKTALLKVLVILALASIFSVSAWFLAITLWIDLLCILCEFGIKQYRAYQAKRPIGPVEGHAGGSNA